MKMVIVGNSQKACCCWQGCERSGAKPKAIKSSVRGHAKHDGKLQQRGERGSRPVSLSIRHPPPSSASASRQTHTVPKNTPPLLFTHPSEANRLQRGSSFKTFTPWAGETLGQINSPEITPLSPPKEFHFLNAKVYTLARKQYNLPQKCLRSVVLCRLLCMITGSSF